MKTARLVMMFVLTMISFGCTQAQQAANDPATLEKIQDTVTLRRALCAKLPMLEGYVPDDALFRARAACAVGDSFQQVSAALGGCYEVPVTTHTPAPTESTAPSEPKQIQSDPAAQ